MQHQRLITDLSKTAYLATRNLLRLPWFWVPSALPPLATSIYNLRQWQRVARTGGID